MPYICAATSKNQACQPSKTVKLLVEQADKTERVLDPQSTMAAAEKKLFAGRGLVHGLENLTDEQMQDTLWCLKCLAGN